MSKGPDLSAFPIPRKGGATPIAMDDAAERAAVGDQREGGAATLPQESTASVDSPIPTRPVVTTEAERSAIQQLTPKEEAAPPALGPSGQTVATTVKLDENRYLRLADAGRPSPGRLKRRTIQEIMIEALDEWFERRGI